MWGHPVHISLGTQRYPGYPHFKDFTGKSTHSAKNLKTKLKTFLLVSRVSQAKFEANRYRGF